MTNHDLAFLKKTLRLAKKGIGQVSPNPLVGAIVVKNYTILSQAHYTYEAKTHAEVKALTAAGKSAKGATLYINLEPCSHFGRTPPCVDAIIQAGVKRVVACMRDPNPLVSGRGFRKLKAAGLRVDVGLLQRPAETLNEKFVKFIQRKRPFVLLKAGMSLDGKIATRTGASKWITSPKARDYVQKLRWEYDAVLVGVNTILRDDPKLTLRIDRPKRTPLTKVILDSYLRTPLQAKVLRPRDRGQVVIYTSRKSDSRKIARLEAAGVSVYRAPANNGKVDLRFVCRHLGGKNVTSILIEGGSEINWSGLHQNLIDKVLFILAPKIIGGKPPVPVVGGPGIDSLSRCIQLRDLKPIRLDPDLAIEGYVC